MTTLTMDQVKTALLAAQGLLNSREQPATKKDVLATIQRLNILQIDTISVVNRSPYLVLWSRIGAFDLDWLSDLLADGALFEYWSHEACFIPIEHYPIHRRLALDGFKGWGERSRKWLDENPEVTQQVLSYIRDNGGARSADFKQRNGEVTGGWWNRKLEKQVLEHLYNVGEVMIAERRRFQRIYDLRERVLPEWDDTQAPDYETVRDQLILDAVRALGITSPLWVADYFRMHKRQILPAVDELVKQKDLKTIRVEGYEHPFLFHPENQNLIKSVRDGKVNADKTHFFSPFDPIVWDRQRLSEMFDFDYRIECYTPAEKRQYGYFTLPILRGTDMVGRLDPKAHRKDGIFEVKAIHLEPEVEPDESLANDIASTLVDFARWHDTPEIIITESNPQKFKTSLRKAVKSVM